MKIVEKTLKIAAFQLLSNVDLKYAFYQTLYKFKFQLVRLCIELKSKISNFITEVAEFKLKSEL